MPGPEPPVPTLLDRLVPTFDHRLMRGHATTASVDAASRAIREVALGDARVARALILVRTAGQARGERVRRPWAELGDGDMQFLPLGESPHEIAIGFVGRPWPRGGEVPPPPDVAAFVAHVPEDDVKVAMAIRAQPAAYGTLLVSETRIVVGPGARRPFGLYWRTIRVGSGLVRGSVLRAIARRAEDGVDAPDDAAPAAP